LQYLPSLSFLFSILIFRAMVIYLIIMFAISLIYFASAERLVTYIRLIGIQGLLLCGIAIFELIEINTVNLIFIIAETIIIKAIVIPYLLRRITKVSGVTKVHRQAMPGFYLVILSVAALFASLILSWSLRNPYVDVIYMTIALFSLFTGLSGCLYWASSDCASNHMLTN